MPARSSAAAARRLFRSAPRPRAFTLLELLLALAVMSAIAAVSIPQITTLLGDRRLVRGAEQLRIEMTRVRVDAMRQGRTIVIEGLLENGAFRVRPFVSVADATESTGPTAAPSALLSGADQAMVTPMQTGGGATAAPQEKTIELPEGITVTAVAVVSAARAAEVEQAALSDQAAGWSRPILFYPDGTTSTAAVTLQHPTVGHIIVKLRGITGDVTLTDVMPNGNS